ncbi:MAG TPA: hypothetical protein VIC58_10640 [Actinomycetota bacterium]|jgi:hypothetical protein
MRRLPVLALVPAFALLAASCSSDDPSPSGPTGGSSSDMVAIPATSDLFAGDPQRVSLGLVMNDGSFVSFGDVDIAFSFVGTAAAPTDPQPGPTEVATFVATYGTPDGGDGPVVTSPSEGRGVYQASDVTFDEPGFWVATVTAEIDGLGTQRAEATLPVAEAPAIPAPGDEAPATENLTMESTGVPLAAIDSRAATRDRVPDPELHEWTIARAIQEGRPALVVFATPVYCVSRFCGPVTDMVEELSRQYGDRAVFIHVEIYEEFAPNQVVNEAALEWLEQPDGSLTEPWLYLIGADGVIVDRWASMWGEDEVAAELDALPPMGGS